MANKKHLTLQEAASEYGRSYWRLREAILRGELKASQFSKGGKFYLKPSDLEDYFERNIVSPLAGKVV